MVGTDANPVSYNILRHSTDVNDEYIKSIESDSCLYEDLIDKYESSIINGFFYRNSNGELVYPNVDRYGDPDILSSNTDDIDDSVIYNKILIDYYMQPGTGMDRYSIPVNIEIIANCFQTKGNSGDVILIPKA
jgi:hypothetical protein